VYLYSINTSNGTLAHPVLAFETSSQANLDSLARFTDNRLYFTSTDVENNAVLYVVLNGALVVSFAFIPAVGSLAYGNGTPCIGTANGETESATYMCALSSTYDVNFLKRIGDASVPLTFCSVSPSISLQGKIVVSTNSISVDETTSFSTLHTIF